MGDRMADPWPMPGFWRVLLQSEQGSGKSQPMPLLEGLRVVHSSIHGYGVVATRPFQRGEVICYGDGVLYDSRAEFDDTYALILPRED